MWGLGPFQSEIALCPACGLHVAPNLTCPNPNSAALPSPGPPDLLHLHFPISVIGNAIFPVAQAK